MLKFPLPADRRRCDVMARLRESVQRRQYTTEIAELQIITSITVMDWKWNNLTSKFAWKTPLDYQFAIFYHVFFICSCTMCSHSFLCRDAMDRRRKKSLTHKAFPYSWWARVSRRIHSDFILLWRSRELFLRGKNKLLILHATFFYIIFSSLFAEQSATSSSAGWCCLSCVI